jgi:uncharacterized SAM-binding protein YcdF (DUF218 family)
VRPALLLTLGAGVALISFAALILNLRGQNAAGAEVSQLELTARLAREVAAPTAESLAAPSQPSLEANLGTAYAELRKQMSYCTTGVPSMVVEKVRPGAYDAVFVLGAGVLSEPSERATQWVGDDKRTRALGGYLAAAYFGAAPVLGFAGGVTDGAGRPSEAATMAQFVQSPSFRAAYGRLTRTPVAAHVLEERSTSTIENIAEIASIAKARGWRRMLIVTSHYHTPRTSQIVQAKGLAADVVPAEALVDGALQDKALHEAVCAHYAGPVMLQAIQKEIVAIADLRARAQP